MAGNELTKHFMKIRKNSFKYTPAFQRMHMFLNGGKGRESVPALRAEHNNRLGVRVLLGEKSDLGLCQLVDTLSDKFKMSSKMGFTTQPAKSPSVYYGWLAGKRNRYSVPAELKFTESSYSSKSIYISLFTDLQQECPDIYTQLVIGHTGSLNYFTFGHNHNNRAGVKNVGGMKDLLSWLDGQTNIFPSTLDTTAANVYVFFSDNFLEMFPTNHRHILNSVETALGKNCFVRFSYCSRHPITYNALQTYCFPAISDLLVNRIPFGKYYVNVLANVQRQDLSENMSASRFSIRMLAHSSLFRADQPMNELMIAQKTPAEDNANMAFIDKFNDYKTATDSIFISEFSDKLQVMHPNMLLLYFFTLAAWPIKLSQMLPLFQNLPQNQYAEVFKQTHTQILNSVMHSFDNDVERNSIIRSLAFGRPEFIEDLRYQLWQYTIANGSAFNINAAKILLDHIMSNGAYVPEEECYEYDSQSVAKSASSSLVASEIHRVPRSTDSIWKIDCEFVRHSIPLRGHIHEISKKQRFSWAKIAPEA